MAVNVSVKLKDGESFDKMLKRFKKKYQESGVLADIRRKEFYMSPSLKEREKRKQAERRRLKEERKRGIIISEKDK